MKTLFGFLILLPSACQCFPVVTPPMITVLPGRSTQVSSRALSASNNLDPEYSPSNVSRRSAIKNSLVIGALSAFPALSNAANKEKALSEEYRQGTAALSDMDDQAPVPREAYKKLPSGVVFADLRQGSGEEAKNGSRCNIQWVLRKSNGYFVDSSEVSGSVPFIFTVGDGSAIQGVNEGIQGMKVGGVRRLLIPPSLAYVDGLEDGKPGPMPVGFGPRQQMRRVQNVRANVPGEYVFLEIQLTRLR